MNFDPSSLNIASITGIVAITMLIIEVSKYPLSKYKWVQNIPVFVYSVVISAILATFCNKVLHTLPGKTCHVVWQSIMSSASAGGFYTWIRNPETMQNASKLWRRKCSKESSS